MPTTILLIRHGQTEWNVAKLFRGTHDVGLDDNGRQQARYLGVALGGRRIEGAYSSPLSRATETAELALGDGGPGVVVDERLIDFSYGDWTGIEESEVARRWPAELGKWQASPHELRVPGGDTLMEVFERAMGAMDELAARHDGQTICLFAHRVVNKLLVLGALGLGVDRFNYVRQDNCCLNEFRGSEGGYVVVTLNDTCHLRRDGVEMLSIDF